MCLTIFYICPHCTSRCGRSKTISNHGEDTCPGIIEQTRLMKPPHFVDWFCEGRNCPYSEEGRRKTEAEERALLKKQKAAVAHRISLASPSTSRQGPVPRAESHDSDDTEDTEDTQMKDLGEDEAAVVPRAESHDSDDTEMSEVGEGEGTTDMLEPPVDAAAEADQEDREATPRAAARPGQTRCGSEIPMPAPPPLTNRHPNLRPAWARSGTAKDGIEQYKLNFDEETWAQINALASTTVSGASLGNSWEGHEERLLVLLRNCGVPWAYMNSFIPRHTTYGCKSQYSRLKRNASLYNAQDTTCTEPPTKRQRMHDAPN
ncbi:uncharacterized protein B0H64DRAFT_377580 [Chaetomium fimeti]|uniref:Myb-like domain-containing protein n=1 Tax=Chaetomium fimeti TaxID=1854472 RepID=A0AAE0LPC6_9PEZI|nr:hypothetical protein B0H64DRAFT_377580 [Chaetomium fimeti]